MPDESDDQDESSTDEFEVLPENWSALEIFLDCSTQWKHAPMGGLTGLEYPAVRTVMEFHAVPLAEMRERFKQVRLLERGALNEMNKANR
ncbi:DUF1799 domain-containing protein [Salinicola sp. JS01]|uniref:DUF1799 domain-containing protein n=1 Tax=Salinicola sp. JS01 TaxID=3050071 RepID=UPI00255C186E|nr:DUF1799 domain-containing protein [Salinicola sp. JS01]WIX35033.1 DUF1799 domain-containing protein [Salinicola sp. JS01]